MTAASFALAIAPANDGVTIRRTYDLSEPDDLDLEVDGVRVTELSTRTPFAAGRRWVERGVFDPPQLTRGQSRLGVRIVPRTGASAARFEAWSLRSD